MYNIQNLSNYNQTSAAKLAHVEYLYTCLPYNLRKGIISLKRILSQAISKISLMKPTFCIALLLGTVLTAPIVILNTHAQGPPGTQSSQLTSLADRWTKWIVSIDTTKEPNPFTTTYQGDCSQLIQGNTMFLVGVSGAGTVNHGICIVPSGTTIFFPLNNFILADCTTAQQMGKPPDLCTSDIRTPALGQPFADLRELTDDFIAGVDVNTLQSTLNGVPLEFARVQSPPGGFGVRVPANNAAFGDLTSLFVGTISLHALVDGYWSLLSPLPPGEHTLIFGGCSGSACQTNSYTLVV